MPVTVTYTTDDIPVESLKDGEIGVITQWSVGDYKGRVIQRYKDYLVPIGLKSDCGFSGGSKSSQCRVRKLRIGDVITVIAATEQKEDRD